MNKITIGGKDWEVRGYYPPQTGDKFVANTGVVWTAEYDWEAHPRLILHPIAQRHTIGGIVWEEIGEVRVVECGEWGLYPGTKEITYWETTSVQEYHIVRPVALA